MSDAKPSLLLSPRTNLSRRGVDLNAVVSELVPADAENKLHHKKLYLVLDLDETLIYAKRMEPGASPKGTQISVRGDPFDVVKRPGLKQFLQTASSNFVIFLYTMGDQGYTEAVLRVIDPENKFFRGARPQSGILRGALSCSHPPRGSVVGGWVGSPSLLSLSLPLSLVCLPGGVLLSPLACLAPHPMATPSTPTLPPCLALPAPWHGRRRMHVAPEREPTGQEPRARAL
jgi:hypothetical protein